MYDAALQNAMRTVPPGYASGGHLGPGAPPGQNVGNMVTGALKAPVPGRSDHLPISVPQGSYVIPADVVSAIGQGNTDAGFQKLEQALGPALPPNQGAPGGVDIMAAGGEFIVPPDVVAKIGEGNMNQGHAVLDELVKQLRADAIKTLKSMPGPQR